MEIETVGVAERIGLEESSGVVVVVSGAVVVEGGLGVVASAGEQVRIADGGFADLGAVGIADRGPALELTKDYCLLIISEEAAVTIVGVGVTAGRPVLRGWVDEIRFTLHEIRRPAAGTLFTSERATTEPRPLVIPSLPRDLAANERPLAL